MTSRRRRLSPAARGIDRTLMRHAVRTRRRPAAGDERIGITYPLQEERWRERRMARGLLSAFGGETWSAVLLPTVRGEIRPQAPDVTVALLTVPVQSTRGLRSDVFTAVWVLGTVDEWPAAVLDGADLLLAGSGGLADDLEARTGIMPVIAHPSVQRPDRDAEETDRPVTLTFVGDGARHADRVMRLVQPATPGRVRLLGPHWGADPRTAPLWGGDPGPDDLVAAYRSSATVLGLRESHRHSLDPSLLEAALHGALPITQDVEAAADMLGDALPSFTRRSELDEHLRGAGDEPARREALGRLAGRIVADHTHERRAASLEAAIAAERAKPLVAVTTCTPDAKVAEQWGDTHFARQFARALRRVGFRTRVDLHSDWGTGTMRPADVIVHLRGLDRLTPPAGPLALLWVISHPEAVTADECAGYDAVLTASSAHAEVLRTEVSVPVVVMPQAADPRVFRFCDREPALRSELLFVGNARWPVRRVPRWLHELGAPLTIYGARWERYAEREHLRGSHVPNAELHRLYRSADVVVNDHWADMRLTGFVSNRIFDALACGAFVISDHVPAIAELFGDAVPTFSTREELRAVLDTFLDDPAARTRHALAGRDIVLQHHTFDVRAAQVAALVDELRPGLRPPERT